MVSTSSISRIRTVKHQLELDRRHRIFVVMRVMLDELDHARDGAVGRESTVGKTLVPGTLWLDQVGHHDS